MKIPKDATHRSAGHFYRRVNGIWELYGSGHAWIATACEQSWLDANALELSECLDRDQAAQDIIEASMSGPFTKQGISHDAALAIYDAGYRKFEIVEEDV